MRAVEYIQTKKKIKDKEEKKRRLQDDEPEDMELYIRWNDYRGINTAKSVFDAQAIFNTKS